MVCNCIGGNPCPCRRRSAQLFHEGMFVYGGLNLPIPNYTQHVGCPICDERMVMLNAHDSGICPRHGEISGMDFIRVRGMSKLDALIEIRANQIKYEIDLMVQAAMKEIRGW